MNLAGSNVAFDTTTENYTVSVSGKCVLTCYVSEIRSFKVSSKENILPFFCIWWNSVSYERETWEENHVSKANITCQYLYETWSVGGRKPLFTYKRERKRRFVWFYCLIWIIWYLERLFALVHRRATYCIVKRHDQVENFHMRMATNRKTMIVCLCLMWIEWMNVCMCVWKRH